MDDLFTFSWLATCCIVAGIVSFVFRRYLPWNGHTWKAFTGAGVACLVAKWALAYVAAWLGIVMTVVISAILIFLILYYGGPCYDSLRNLIRRWRSSGPK